MNEDQPNAGEHGISWLKMSVTIQNGQIKTDSLPFEQRSIFSDVVSSALARACVPVSVVHLR